MLRPACTILTGRQTRQTPFLVAAVLQLLACVQAQERLQWSVLVHGPGGAEERRGGGAIAVGIGYYLTIGVRRCTPAGGLTGHSCAPATEHGCDVMHVSRELVAFGQVPHVIVAAPGTHETQMSVQSQLINTSTQAYSTACAVWVALLPSTATAAPASLQIVVSADEYGVALTSVHTAVLRVPVLAAAGILMRAATTQPPLFTDAERGDASWHPQLIPGVSPLAFFAKGLGASQSDALCATDDEFRSYYWVDLKKSFASETSGASCQGGVGAVHTRSALIFHSPTGIEEIHSGAHRVSVSADLADLCVDRLVVTAQSAPYRRGFNDIVLALEPVGWRRGTGTTAFIRDEPPHGYGYSKTPGRSFREVVDHRGLNLASWSGQLFSSQATRMEVTVIAATFALTQPRTFLFLITASSLHTSIDEQVAMHTSAQQASSSYILVAFDGSVQRWTRRLTLDDQLRLVGLRYASSVRPVLWAWGSTVLFSFDHGHSFHPVAGLSDHQFNNPVVDFVSTATDEWALLYADGTVILGCTDSEPRPGMSISPSSSDDKPISLLFTHEGALVGLHFVCDDGGGGSSRGTATLTCAPKRILLAHTSDAWKFSVSRSFVTDLVQAGAYTCDSFISPQLNRWYSEPSQNFAPAHMLREQVSAEGTAEKGSLPSRIFFDLHERYEFKLRLSADENLEPSDWRPVAFQLNSPDGDIQMSIESLWHQSAVADSSSLGSNGRHIEYTVNLQDTAKSSGRTITSGLSLDVAQVGKHLPGKDMTVATLQVLHNRDQGLGSAPCPRSAASRQQRQHTLTLLTGCPPGRRIEFDVESSRRVPRALNQQHVEVDHGCVESNSDVASAHAGTDNQTASEVSNVPSANVPCVWAGHDFYPVFRIVDDLADGGHSEAGNTYNGSYRLTIVAGGPSLEDMVEYTPEQQEAYSMWPTSLGAKHSNPVYGFLNADLEGDRPTVSGMSWICSPGSPCSHVLPRFPHTPEIFFRFQFDTTYSEGTYCDYRTEFTLRLHGLPMAFQTIAKLTFGTTAACFGLVMLSYVVRLVFFPPQQC
jgi:hypothetical protein